MVRSYRSFTYLFSTASCTIHNVCRVTFLVKCFRFTEIWTCIVFRVTRSLYFFNSNCFHWNICFQSYRSFNDYLELPSFVRMFKKYRLLFYMFCLLRVYAFVLLCSYQPELPSLVHMFTELSFYLQSVLSPFNVLSSLEFSFYVRVFRVTAPFYKYAVLYKCDSDTYTVNNKLPWAGNITLVA